MDRVAPSQGDAVKIVVEELSVRGRTVRFSEADAWAVEAAGRALDAAPKEVTGSAQIVRAKRGGVDVTVTVEAAAPRTCDRCGREGVQRVGLADLVLPFLPQGTDVETEEEELDEDDLDYGWFADGAVDLGDVVGEAIALHVPMKWTCADGGLDEAACDAAVAAQSAATVQDDAPIGHPAFAALKKLL